MTPSITTFVQPLGAIRVGLRFFNFPSLRADHHAWPEPSMVPAPVNPGGILLHMSPSLEGHEDIVRNIHAPILSKGLPQPLRRSLHTDEQTKKGKKHNKRVLTDEASPPAVPPSGGTAQQTHTSYAW